MESAMAGAALGAAVSAEEVKHDYHAYLVLYCGYVALPLIAGLDKFFMFLCDWTKYLAPPVANLFGPGVAIHAVGVVEIAAGIGLAFKPHIFAPVVAVWLWAIILNLLLLGGPYDVALRDFGLSLGALALWRLGQHFDARKAVKNRD
jgi:hypothetical protein